MWGNSVIFSKKSVFVLAAEKIQESQQHNLSDRGELSHFFVKVNLRTLFELVQSSFFTFPAKQAKFCGFMGTASQLEKLYPLFLEEGGNVAEET